MNALKRTSATLIAFAISASAFAGSDLETRVHELEKKIDMMSTTTPADTFGPKLALARPDPNGKGWFLTFDVLYWQSKVGGIDYATTGGREVLKPVVKTASFREAEFDWTFAFKAGIGYKFFHDGWDSHFEYTYFRNDASDNYSTTLPGVIRPSDELLAITSDNNAALSPDASFATQSSSTVKLSFNDINLDLGRDFFVSKNLSLRPSIGLKSSWISLRETADYTGGGQAYIDTAVASIETRLGITTKGTPGAVKGLGPNTLHGFAHERFIGVGPRGSLDTKWFLGNNISVYGDLAGALLFGYFRTESEASYSAQPRNSLASEYKFHRLVPTVDFELGLMYEKYMMCETQHFTISLGYETQYFWEVNYLKNNVAPQGIGMYGINLDLRWDF